MNMELRDIKRYKSYLPLRMQKQDILKYIGGHIGEGWLNHFWLDKFDGYYKIRYRFGDINEVQIYNKDKEWEGIPLKIWIKFSELSNQELDEQCWQYIYNQRELFKIKQKKIKFNDGNDLMV